MSRYLLSVHSVEGAPHTPMSEGSFQKIHELHEEMKSAGAWVLTGALHAPNDAVVVDATKHDVITTDGPFAESKEHIAGFYVIEASDRDAALQWASKASARVGKPIEVRQFRDGTEG